MGKNISYLFLFPVFFMFTSCGTGRYGINKSWSFYKVNTPGTIAVDDNGNELTPRRDTTSEIFLKTKHDRLPEILAVFMISKYYNPVITKIDSAKIYIGESLPGNQRVELSAGTGYTFWKITAGEAMSDIVVIKQKPETPFYLFVRHNEKKKVYGVKNISELVSPLHY